MSIKRLLAITLLLAGAACASHPGAPKNSGKIAIVQIDDVTLGSKDQALQKLKDPYPAILIETVAEKLKAAGARVVVIDLQKQRDPTLTALNAAQEFLGQNIESSSIERDATGQLKLDAPTQVTTPATTQSGKTVQEYVPTFASTWLSFSDAYRQTPEQLKKSVSGMIVYIGATTSPDDFIVLNKDVPKYPRFFADARLADQILMIQSAPKSE